MEKVKLIELGTVAKKILSLLPQEGERAVLVTLHGDLGAGKTTLVQSLGKELGVESIIQSPTYVLMKSYPLDNARGKPASGGRFKKLIHIDAYRLNEPAEFSTLKPESFLSDPTSLVVLEWPEKVGDLLPKPDLRLNLSSEGAGTDERFIEIV